VSFNFQCVSDNSCLGIESIQVCTLRRKHPSTTQENPFFSDASSERAKFCCQRPRSTYRFYRRSSCFRGYRDARNLAQGTTLIFQDKSGSSDPIGTVGCQSTYRGSGFRESRRCPFIAVEVADRRNAESTFGTEPTALAPGHIKQACKGGQALL
jgi:hypothetical protein